MSDPSSLKTDGKRGQYQRAHVDIKYGRKRVLKPLERPPTATAGSSRPKTPKQGFDVDAIAQCMDANVVRQWAERAQSLSRELRTWWAADDNALHFSHFWMSMIPESDRHGLVAMELDILLKEFAVAMDKDRAPPKATKLLMRICLPELPGSFDGGDGSDCLDVVNTLMMPKAEQSRAHLLSAIKIRDSSLSSVDTKELCLATRAFGLHSLTAALIGFYRRAGQDELEQAAALRQSQSTSLNVTMLSAVASGGTSSAASSLSIPSDPVSASRRPGTAAASRTDDVYLNALMQATKFDYADVIYYLLSRGLVDMNAKDGLGRTALFVAVVHRRYDALEMFFENADALDLDAASASGNTPLHAAVSNGDIDTVQRLLAAGAAPTVGNPQCGGATPLHLASMLGFEDIVSLLKKHNITDRPMTADHGRPMTARQIADSYGRQDIADMLDIDDSHHP